MSFGIILEKQNRLKKQNCVIWMQGFTVYIKTDNVYKDIAEDVETRFDTSNYQLHRQLAIGKNKNVIGLMKDELSGKIVTEFFGLKAKTYSYFIDNSSGDKTKNTKTCVIIRKLKL